MDGEIVKMIIVNVHKMHKNRKEVEQPTAPEVK